MYECASDLLLYTANVSDRWPCSQNECPKQSFELDK